MASLSSSTGRGGALWRAIRGRAELLVALLGWLTLTSMLIGSGYSASSPQVLLIDGLALAYAVLVIWAPPRLPVRQAAPPTRESLKRAALLVWPAMVLSII